MPKAIDHIALVVRDPARSAQLFAQVFDDARVEPGEGEHDTLVRLGGVCLVLVAAHRRPRATATTSPSRWARPSSWPARSGCARRASNA